MRSTNVFSLEMQSFTKEQLIRCLSSYFISKLNAQLLTIVLHFAVVVGACAVNASAFQFSDGEQHIFYNYRRFSCLLKSAQSNDICTMDFSSFIDVP